MATGSSPNRPEFGPYLLLAARIARAGCGESLAPRRGVSGETGPYPPESGAHSALEPRSRVKRPARVRVRASSDRGFRQFGPKSGGSDYRRAGSANHARPRRS